MVKKLVALLLVFAMLSAFTAVISFAAVDTSESVSDTSEATTSKVVSPRTMFQLKIALIIRLFDKLIQLIKSALGGGSLSNFNLSSITG